MDKIEFIERHGEAAYVQWLEEAAKWYESHPEGIEGKNRCWYDALLEYFKTHDKSWRKEHLSEVANFRKTYETDGLDFFMVYYEKWYKNKVKKDEKRLSD